MALSLALDTNRYTDLCRNDGETRRIVQLADAVFIPLVVIAELRAGFSLGRHGHENEHTLQRFLAKPGVSPLYPGDATTQVYADLYRQLRIQGTPLPTNDLWIAALAVEHSLTLHSRDRHFAYLPQVSVV